jgi:hypothetical protein
MKINQIVTTVFSLPGVSITLLASSLFGQCLQADVLIYDGFPYAKNTADTRIGWTDAWGTVEGNPTLMSDDLDIRGLDSIAGSMSLMPNSVTLSQINTTASGVVYGSFRVRMSSYVNDSAVGLLILDPESSDARPVEARLALIVKGWRIPFSSVVVSGKKTQADKGAEIDADQTYLVLFKLVNPSGKKGSLTMWICAPNQMQRLIAEGLSEEYLERAGIGSGVEQIARRVTAVIPADDEPIFKTGSVICLMSRFGAYTTFDEIRLSTSSLSEAAGAPAK